jgi:hypothetical protein
MLNDLILSCQLLNNKTLSFSEFLKQFDNNLLRSISNNDFERLLNVDFFTKVGSSSLVGLDVDSEPYSSMPLDAIDIYFKYLKQYVNISDSCLLDFGAGKGFMLFSCLLNNIKRVNGVELSEPLFKINLENFSNLNIDASIFNILNINAKDTPMNIFNECNIFSFFNPFGVSTLNPILLKIIASKAMNDRPIYLLYFNCNFVDTILDKGFKIIHKFEPLTDSWRWTSNGIIFELL